MILVFHQAANVFREKLHRSIYDDLLSLSSLLEFLSIVVVEM